MREGTAAQVAALSGGEQIRFLNENDLETKLAVVADHIHNGYTLSFRPSSHEPGFHNIVVHVLNQQTHFEVKARTSFWFDGIPAEE
jgi:hypothetical protein